MLRFMDVSGERSGIVITRGASNGRLVAGVIPEGAKVYVWTQNDSAGEKWQRDICANTNAAVKRANIPAPHKDLNEWTLDGEASSDDLLEALVQAKPVMSKHWQPSPKEFASIRSFYRLRCVMIIPNHSVQRHSTDSLARLSGALSRIRKQIL